MALIHIITNIGPTHHTVSNLECVLIPKLYQTDSKYVLARAEREIERERERERDRFNLNINLY